MRLKLWRNDAGTYDVIDAVTHNSLVRDISYIEASELVAKANSEVSDEDASALTAIDDALKVEARRRSKEGGAVMSTITMTTYSVTGKTYEHQSTIKALGGVWDADRNMWIVDAKAAEWLSNRSNFGRKAIRLGTGLVITPMVEVSR